MDTALPKQQQKTVIPSNPEAKTQDDRFSTPSNPGAMDMQSNRKRDGDRIANNMEKKGAVPAQSDTAQRSPDVNSFSTVRSTGGTHSSEDI